MGEVVLMNLVMIVLYIAMSALCRTGLYFGRLGQLLYLQIVRVGSGDWII